MANQQIIQKHQVLMDMAIQFSGSAESLVSFANLNGLGITDDVLPGTLLMMADVFDPKVLKYLTDGKYKPTTVFPDDDELTGEGIEYWAIEYDFIIS